MTTTVILAKIIAFLPNLDSFLLMLDKAEIKYIYQSYIIYENNDIKSTHNTGIHKKKQSPGRFLKNFIAHNTK